MENSLPTSFEEKGSKLGYHVFTISNMSRVLALPTITFLHKVLKLNRPNNQDTNTQDLKSIFTQKKKKEKSRHSSFIFC